MVKGSSPNTNKHKPGSATNPNEENEPNPDTQQNPKEVEVTELPSFEGFDAATWVKTASNYFNFLSITSDDVKVAIGMSRMRGFALYWCVFVRECTPHLTWDKLSSALINRFSGDAIPSAGFLQYEAIAQTEGGRNLFTISQTGTVDEYIGHFVKLAIEVPELPPKLCLSSFVAGLKGDIRMKLTAKELSDVLKAMIGAVTAEHNLANQLAAVEHGSDPKPHSLVKLYLETGGISLRVEGKFMGREHSILISSNASHCFITDSLVLKHKLPSQATEDHGRVSIGGPNVHSLKKYNLNLEIGGISVVEDFYVFQLVPDVDIVLGNSWLVTLERFDVFEEKGHVAITFSQQGKLQLPRAVEG